MDCQFVILMDITKNHYVTIKNKKNSLHTFMNSYMSLKCLVKYTKCVNYLILQINRKFIIIINSICDHSNKSYNSITKSV